MAPYFRSASWSRGCNNSQTPRPRSKHTMTRKPMPTAWLILMNSRLSAVQESQRAPMNHGEIDVRLVQRRTNREPSRTKSLGISASSWKVSDMAIVNNVKEGGIGGAMGELKEKTGRISVSGQMAFLGIRGASGRNDNPAGTPSFARSASPFIIAPPLLLSTLEHVLS